MGVLTDFLALFARWRTWMLMANQDIALRYRRSLLGPFWISIAMAVTILGIGLLYAKIQHQPFHEFLTWFGCGLLAWSFISSIVTEGCQVVMESEGQLRAVSLPIPVLAARTVYRNAVILFHNALVVGLVLVWMGRPLTLQALWALAGFALYFPLGVFLGVALGPVCARFRDLSQVFQTVMQLAFFLTPIFWVPDSHLHRFAIVQANPLFHLIQIVRSPLLGEAPSNLDWIVSLSAVGVAACLALISTAVSRGRIYLWL